MSSEISNLSSTFGSIFDAFHEFLKPFLDIADGASTLIDMFV